MRKKDFRLKANREELFNGLYKFNLKHRIMPGLVYLYLPELANMFHWEDEQKLWFAFLNGLTQNPITSLRLFLQLDQVPKPGDDLKSFGAWFDDNWHNLQFDTDRKYQKKETTEAIRQYARLVAEHGTQAKMLTQSYEDLWRLVSTKYFSFGRLSSFSYLEYVHIYGYGADCTSLNFRDKTGSKSHRNGMLLLIGNDHLVWDKRQPGSHDGDYGNLEMICEFLEEAATTRIGKFMQQHPGTPNVSRFTFESNLCTFKNHFFGHRYPGVYADMAYQRILKAKESGLRELASIFLLIRKLRLPSYLLMEREKPGAPTIKQRAMQFKRTGFPYRGELFL